MRCSWPDSSWFARIAVVLERDRDRELHRMRQHLLEPAEDRPQALVELVRGQAGRLQQVVVFDVLARVHRFLADEPEHLLLQLGVLDLVAIVAHRIHEEAFAGREQQRQRVHEVRDRYALHVPVARAFGGSAKRMSRRTGIMFGVVMIALLVACIVVGGVQRRGRRRAARGAAGLRGSRRVASTTSAWYAAGRMRAIQSAPFASRPISTRRLFCARRRGSCARRRRRS